MNWTWIILIVFLILLFIGFYYVIKDLANVFSGFGRGISGAGESLVTFLKTSGESFFDFFKQTLKGGLTVNGNGKTCREQLDHCQACVGTTRSDPEFKPWCDRNDDGVIDVFDIVLLQAWLYNKGICP